MPRIPLRAGTLAFVIVLAVAASFTSSMRGETPNTIVDVLKLFPGYHVLTLRELAPDVRDFLNQENPKQNPSVVGADFDGDGTPDYALLIKADKASTTRAVILLCPTVKTCRIVYDLDVSVDSTLVYLKPVPRGTHLEQTDAIDSTSGPAELTLKTAAVELNYFEKSSVVLYWNRARKKIAEVQTSD